jgi:UDP-glucose 4-epimerase
MTSVLVVGGAGYIGSHMVRMLAREGYEVTVLDNLSRGHRDAVPAAEFVKGDLLNPSDLKALFQRRQFQGVLHFAALCYVGESVTAPREYFRNNLVGTLNLVDAMLDAGVRRLIFSSTCATYGNPVSVPLTEEHPQLPINPYGRSKLMIEQFLADYGVAYGMRSIVLRYFNAAGCDPGGGLGERHDPETHLVPLILREARRVRDGGDPADTELTLFGNDFPTPDGSCIRDYVHVNDLCSAHLAALRRLSGAGESGVEAFNLGNGRGFSVLEVISAACRLTGIDIRYRIGSRRPGDPAQLVGSAEKARSVLGWEPHYNRLEEIIETAWHWQGGAPAESNVEMV